jgi:hypothetical protein
MFQWPRRPRRRAFSAAGSIAGSVRFWAIAWLGGEDAEHRDLTIFRTLPKFNLADSAL